ncbi:MAG: lysophospholipase [Candidatus Helarchaeota archaeon]|nr:lysophospholipase [Candidatus Helarchaeota archaeon]
MVGKNDDLLKYPEYLQKMRTNPVANQGKGGYFSCQSGDKLYYRVWKGPEPGKILLCIHGLGMHGEYYIQVADQLIDENLTIYALDLKHHGKSTGKKGDIKDFKELIEQVGEFVSFLKTKHENHPIFLMGLSMGGCLAINYAVMFPETINGIILMAPACTNVKISWTIILAMPVLGLIYLVRKGKPIIDITKRQGEYTRNPLRIKYDKNDELQITKLSLRYLFQVNKWIKKANKYATNISSPALIMQGTQDKLIPLEGVREFFNHIPIEDKQLIELDGAYHSLFSDPAMVEEGGWALLKNWILSH